MRGEKIIGQNSEADDDKKMKFIKFYRYQRGSKIPAIMKIAANKLNVPPALFVRGTTPDCNARGLREQNSADVFQEIFFHNRLDNISMR